VEKTLDKELRLQCGDGEPLLISDCSLIRDLECSYLQDIRGTDGQPVFLTVGDRVTLWAGPAVVFVGKVQEDQSVLDLLSSQEPAEGDYEDI
jgi:hypothetical protein